MTLLTYCFVLLILNSGWSSQLTHPPIPQPHWPLALPQPHAPRGHAPLDTALHLKPCLNSKAVTVSCHVSCKEVCGALSQLQLSVQVIDL